MASHGEDRRYESTRMNRTKEARQTVKHRIGDGKTAQAPYMSRQISSSSSSSKSGGSAKRDPKDAVVKSRIGAAAAIEALCGKAAAAAAGDKNKQRSKSKSKSASGGSSGGDGGSVVKSPTAGVRGQVRCETTEKERFAPQSIASFEEKCFDKPYRRIPAKCTRPKEKWQNGVYCRDECGSGIIPKRLEFKHSRAIWCSTPLSMYQATIGELGRQILCREKIVPRDVNGSPPCNVCEYALPPCRGYYRKYDCIRPCEEEFVSYKQGRKLYRDRVERYWQPCQSKENLLDVDINTFARQNVYLGAKLKRKFNDSIPCW